MKTKNSPKRSRTSKESVYPTHSKPADPIVNAVPAPSTFPSDPLADIERRMRQADEYSLESTCDVLRKVLAGTEGFRDRSRPFFLLETAFTVSENEGVNPAKLREAVAELKALPLDEQRQRLNGWAASDFDVTPAAERVRWIQDREFIGSLRINLDRWQDKPTSSPSEANLSARYPLIHVEIAAGSTKRDVLEALDKIIHAVRDEWADMIAQEPVTAKRAEKGNGAR